MVTVGGSDGKLTRRIGICANLNRKPSECSKIAGARLRLLSIVVLDPVGVGAIVHRQKICGGAPSYAIFDFLERSAMLIPEICRSPQCVPGQRNQRQRGRDRIPCGKFRCKWIVA